MDAYKITFVPPNYEEQKQFARQLDSVIVIADDATAAIAETKRWLESYGFKFTYSLARWEIKLLTAGLNAAIVIDYNDSYS